MTWMCRTSWATAYRRKSDVSTDEESHSRFASDRPGIAGCDSIGGSVEGDAESVDGEGAVLRVADAPSVVIGGADEREDYLIGGTVGALRLSDGGIVIADGTFYQLRYYDRTGTHLRSVGRQGSGPGEFQRLRSIARASADTVVAWDNIQERLALFPVDGSQAEQPILPGLASAITSLKEWPSSRYFVVGAQQVFRLRDGRMVVDPLPQPIIRPVSEIPVLIQDTLPLLAVTPNGERLLELGPFRGSEFYLQAGLASLLPLGERRLAAVGDSVVYVASTRDTVIQMLSAITGESRGSIHLPAARPVSPEDLELASTRRLQQLQGVMSGRAEAYVEAIPWPANMPTFSDLLVAADQRIWVELTPGPADTSATWLIFEPTGQPSGSVTIDAMLQVLDAGADYVLALTSDELDREAVGLYELREE